MSAEKPPRRLGTIPRVLLGLIVASVLAVAAISVRQSGHAASEAAWVRTHVGVGNGRAAVLDLLHVRGLDAVQIDNPAGQLVAVELPGATNFFCVWRTQILISFDSHDRVADVSDQAPEAVCL